MCICTFQFPLYYFVNSEKTTLQSGRYVGTSHCSLFRGRFLGGRRQIFSPGRAQVLVQTSPTLRVRREARLLAEADEQPVYLEPLLLRQPVLQGLPRGLWRLGASLASPP